MFGEILALNFDCLGSPKISFTAEKNIDASQNSGWGFGWYPHDDYAASIIKYAMAKDCMALLNVIKDVTHFRSTTFLCKIRGTGRIYTQHDTQPFRRSFGGYDWLFLHNGELDTVSLKGTYNDFSGLLEPVSKTDSELAFCFLLSKILANSAKGLTEINSHNLLAAFEELDKLGTADFVVSDGRSLTVFHGKNSDRDLYFRRILPSDKQLNFESNLVSLNLEDPRDSLRTVFLITSFPFDNASFQAMEPGQLLIVRGGSIYWDNFSSKLEASNLTNNAGKKQIDTKEKTDNPNSTQIKQSQFSAQTYSIENPLSEKGLKSIDITPSFHSLAVDSLYCNSYDIVHLSEYNYSSPVEHSTHTFRLQPIEDSSQRVTQALMEISVDGELLQFLDVFGNHSIYYDIQQNYTQLSIKTISEVKVYACPPDDHNPVMRRSQIPLTWMPWQRQMMLPYLLPMELPETQLRQLTDFAMSFVKRNDYHLIDSLLDMNQKIYEDFSYVQGITFLETTPFEVFSTRKGVCQDFANLFICLCRLLNIPARYRVGYIYTGGNYENKIQSDASHAWAEVYLPYLGWRGFDPTNGCLVLQDHVRLACGRNYLDATPISGTIFSGGGMESLKVEVQVNKTLI